MPPHFQTNQIDTRSVLNPKIVLDHNHLADKQVTSSKIKQNSTQRSTMKPDLPSESGARKTSPLTDQHQHDDNDNDKSQKKEVPFDQVNQGGSEKKVERHVEDSELPKKDTEKAVEQKQSEMKGRGNADNTALEATKKVRSLKEHKSSTERTGLKVLERKASQETERHGSKVGNPPSLASSKGGMLKELNRWVELNCPTLVIHFEKHHMNLKTFYKKYKLTPKEALVYETTPRCKSFRKKLQLFRRIYILNQTYSLNLDTSEQMDYLREKKKIDIPCCLYRSNLVEQLRLDTIHKGHKVKKRFLEFAQKLKDYTDSVTSEKALSKGHVTSHDRSTVFLWFEEVEELLTLFHDANTYFSQIYQMLRQGIFYDFHEEVVVKGKKMMILNRKQVKKAYKKYWSLEVEILRDAHSSRHLKKNSEHLGRTKMTKNSKLCTDIRFQRSKKRFEQLYYRIGRLHPRCSAQIEKDVHQPLSTSFITTLYSEMRKQLGMTKTTTNKNRRKILEQTKRSTVSNATKKEPAEVIQLQGEMARKKPEPEPEQEQEQEQEQEPEPEQEQLQEIDRLEEANEETFRKYQRTVSNADVFISQLYFDENGFLCFDILTNEAVKDDAALPQPPPKSSVPQDVDELQDKLRNEEHHKELSIWEKYFLWKGNRIKPTGDTFISGTRNIENRLEHRIPLRLANDPEVVSQAEREGWLAELEEYEVDRLKKKSKSHRSRKVKQTALVRALKNLMIAVFADRFSETGSTKKKEHVTALKLLEDRAPPKRQPLEDSSKKKTVSFADPKVDPAINAEAMFNNLVTILEDLEDSDDYSVGSGETRAGVVSEYAPLRTAYRPQHQLQAQHGELKHAPSMTTSTTTRKQLYEIGTAFRGAFTGLYSAASEVGGLVTRIGSATLTRVADLSARYNAELAAQKEDSNSQQDSADKKSLMESQRPAEKVKGDHDDHLVEHKKPDDVKSVGVTKAVDGSQDADVQKEKTKEVARKDSLMGSQGAKCSDHFDDYKGLSPAPPGAEGRKGSTKKESVLIRKKKTSNVSKHQSNGSSMKVSNVKPENSHQLIILERSNLSGENNQVSSGLVDEKSQDERGLKDLEKWGENKTSGKKTELDARKDSFIGPSDHKKNSTETEHLEGGQGKKRMSSLFKKDITDEVKKRAKRISEKSGSTENQHADGTSDTRELQEKPTVLQDVIQAFVVRRKMVAGSVNEQARDEEASNPSFDQ